MEEKIAAIQVVLLEWFVLDKNTIRLYFEKEPEYYYSTEVNSERTRDSVFTGYGYLEIILVGEYENINLSRLSDYVGEGDVIIREDNGDIIVFFDGNIDRKQEWSSDFGLKFKEKKINHIPLELDKWKTMYQDAVLNYAEIYDEHWASLEIKFFLTFKAQMETIIMSSLFPAESVELIEYKNKLFAELYKIEVSIKERADHDKENLKSVSPSSIEKRVKYKSVRKGNNGVLLLLKRFKKFWR